MFYYFKLKIKKLNKGYIWLNKIDKFNKIFKDKSELNNFKKYIINISHIEYHSFIKSLCDANIK